MEPHLIEEVRHLVELALKAETAEEKDRYLVRIKVIMKEDK